MARDRKCILCETVHASKQEMDEHMRSMLHHRELENLKGRDCGHECRVCKVTVVSLTDYASHISSPTHKQNVEAAEKKPAGNGREEEYFDRALVDLIEKRKEKIRKEKEAAAAKLAKEEEERRRKEEMQQRLKAQERIRLQSQQSAWHRNNHYHNMRAGEARPWQNFNQGRSATWHAQEPPYFQRWSSGEFANGGLCSNQGFQGAFPGNQQSRLPWVSNGGSSNGIYGRNNISQHPQRPRPLSFMEQTSLKYPPLPRLFSQFQKSNNDQGAQQGDGLQNQGGQTPEPDHSSSKSSKAFGSNPKLDKACRWTPYPVSKGLESAPHKDAVSSEKFPKVHKPQGQNKAPETSALNRQSRPEQKQKPTSSVEEKVRHETNGKSGPRDGSSSSSSRSSSAQREDLQKPVSAPANQKANKPPQAKVMTLTSGSEQGKASSQVQAHSKPGFSSQAQSVGPLQSKQQRQLPETLRKARQIVLEKRGSLDSSKSNRMEAAPSIMKGQQRDHLQSQVGVNKENRQNTAKLNLQDSDQQEKPELPSSDSSQFLQSLHVSTSTMESSDLAVRSREDEENKKKEDEEKETSQAAQDEEAMQTAEAGQSSESDSCRSGDAQANAASVSKLHLPTVLKRDLTKHISTKNKAGSHEPNLNIARRVRNLSESRRSDTEKDSGLKPTVRQLISSSGSRRNVNWEQVYQEVRKKQDKGKGMPRFGIEMVPFEQEDQSQEEEDIPLLEGFQWDSLIDASAPGASRKRSLSESSIAPASTHSLFTALVSVEAAQRETLSPKQRGSSDSQGGKDDQRQIEVEQMLKQFEAKEQQKQPEKLTTASVKALQRSDSIIPGDSSSGTELCDSQGTGKRRRTRGDAPSAETTCLEHNSKRRKVKSKKERLQIDQLLAVSLREDELSRSLQTLDTSLIQARAALEAAYLEVQRLMVVKQQMTGEMSTLRNKRIELLKGMQGNLEEAPPIKLKEERMDSVEVDLLFSPVSLSSVTDMSAAAAPPSPGPGPPADPASPPSSSLPFTPMVIKQEPHSPVYVSSEPVPVDVMTPCPHSTTPELQPDPTLHLHLSPEREPELQQTKAETQRESFNAPADGKDGSSGLLETTQKAVQTTTSCLLPPPDSKASIKLMSCSRRSSEAGSVVESAANHTFEVPSVLNLPNSPSELRSGKRVRKLKKRKVLKKAQGAEQPESSDTELDGEALRARWPCRPRRRPSGSSQVSTSTQPPEDRDGDVNMEGGEEEEEEVVAAALSFTTVKVEPKSPKQRVELPPVELTVTLDSEENMEVSADSHQPHVTEGQTQDSSRPEPQSLACNHVSSTSDMDLCKSSDSDMPFAITLPKIIKTSSEVSSDHGEDDLPTDGAFEGHQEAVNAMQIHNGLLYTCSGDRTVKAFDLVSHKCVGVFAGHTSKVSCLLVSAAPSLHHRLYSGSSDQTIRCYSLKTRELEQQFSLSDRVLCLHSRWKILYAGLANGTVVTFNLKTNKQMDVFECHGPRAVSCLASSQEGARSILLVGSYDSTISVRDAKSGLLLRTLEGHAKTVLCMKVVNDLVFSGSSDHCVNAHNIHTGELVRVYKGHSHAVPVVAVLGKVMVTACLDKLVRVFDLQSHEQLQVYGGHNDMVMCMAIHKNMIYTGCYDGSVQAVKLNLMQNYRCRWHGCSLVFGLMEHLQQHLLLDHGSVSAQTLKCRWKNCEEFFCARNSSKQGLLMHMQKHAEEEHDVEP